MTVLLRLLSPRGLATLAADTAGLLALAIRLHTTQTTTHRGNQS